MALNLNTVVTYRLEGQRDFTVPFEYLARKFVRVTLINQDGSARQVLRLIDDYRFSDKTTITTNKTWGTQDGYSSIEIRRYTSSTDRLIDFSDGSILRAYELNVAQLQTLHVAEEARDLTADTIGLNNEGNLDARSRRIVNVGDPVSETDALNLRTVLQWNQSAKTEADRAKTEADRSREEANRADWNKNEAEKVLGQTKGVLNEANHAMNEARISENAASNYKSDAWGYRSDALEYSRTANIKAQESWQYSNWSHEWAVSPHGRLVEQPDIHKDYSSLHYATEAGNSARSASDSARRASEAQDIVDKTVKDAANSIRNQVKEDADRAEEAAKNLGNAAPLIGAVDKVVGDNVYWKGPHQMKGDLTCLYNLFVTTESGDNKASFIADGNIQGPMYKAFGNSSDLWGSLNYLKENSEGTVKKTGDTMSGSLTVWDRLSINYIPGGCSIDYTGNIKGNAWRYKGSNSLSDYIDNMIADNKPDLSKYLPKSGGRLNGDLTCLYNLYVTTESGDKKASFIADGNIQGPMYKAFGNSNDLWGSLNYLKENSSGKDVVKKTGDTMSGPLSFSKSQGAMVKLDHSSAGSTINWIYNGKTEAHIGFDTVAAENLVISNDSRDSFIKISSDGLYVNRDLEVEGRIDFPDGTQIDKNNISIPNGSCWVGKDGARLTEDGNIFGRCWRDFGGAASAYEALKWVKEL